MLHGLAPQEFAPQAQQRFLNDLIGLAITKPQTTGEPPQLLSELRMQVLNDLTVGSGRRDLITHGKLARNPRHIGLTLDHARTLQT
jgi:hypothetical protein